jgi:hypothetical protein
MLNMVDGIGTQYIIRDEGCCGVTKDEIKKALEAVMLLSEFCYTQDECKDCIFVRGSGYCILHDEAMSWQTDDRLADLLDQLNEENSNDQT